MTDVSVIIPTVGRNTLPAAIESARRQAGVAVEVIVVCDRPSEVQLPDNVRAQVDLLVTTGGGRGAGHARNLGADLANSEFVAYLDDDDEWLPNKLLPQVLRARTIIGVGRQPVIAARVFQRRAGTSSLVGPSPTRTAQPGDSPEQYLFLRRRVGVNRPILATSTLLTTTETAVTCKWDEKLKRHQDWDWVIKATRVPKATFEQIEDCGTIYTVGSVGSISAQSDWQQSLAWALSWRGDWDDRTLVDFLFSQTLRYALQASDWNGALRIASRAVAMGRPSAQSVFSAILGLFPRKMLERIALRAP